MRERQLDAPEQLAVGHPHAARGVDGVRRDVVEAGDDVAEDDQQRVGGQRDDRRRVPAAGDRQQQEEHREAGDRVEDARQPGDRPDEPAPAVREQAEREPRSRSRAPTEIDRELRGARQSGVDVAIEVVGDPARAEAVVGDAAGLARAVAELDLAMTGTYSRARRAHRAGPRRRLGGPGSGFGVAARAAVAPSTSARLPTRARSTSIESTPTDAAAGVDDRAVLRLARRAGPTARRAGCRRARRSDPRASAAPRARARRQRALAEPAERPPLVVDEQRDVEVGVGELARAPRRRLADAAASRPSTGRCRARAAARGA